ncbi:MAG: hypothetical protein ABFR75_10365 [Acidobacteriota bacterium]
MNRLHEGIDYLLYRIYVWGGFTAIVIYSTIVSLNLEKEPVEKILSSVGIPITLWVLGILVYWWWVFLFKGRRDPDRQSVDISRIGNLKSWTILHNSMALSGGSYEELKRSEKRSNRGLILWYGMQNLLVLWVLGNFWVWVLFKESLPPDYIIKVWAPGVVVFAILMMLLPFLIFRMFKGDDSYIKVLGLNIMDIESVKPAALGIYGTYIESLPPGTSIIAGERLGKTVYIEAHGRQSLTRVWGRVPMFEVVSRSGKLEPGENTPGEIKTFLHKLRKAKRWKGIIVKGDEDGIQINRDSRGVNMWLYDLWLAEQLLEKLKR